jgi:hypothetical protein
MRLLSGVPHMEKHELSKIEFERVCHASYS